MVSPRRPSTKQQIRIWFEFYKLARGDGRYEAALEASRSYYESWGDVDGVPFNRWWDEHSSLFDELKVREVAAVEPHAATLYLAVPLDLDTKRIIQQVRDVVTARQKAAKATTSSKTGRANRVAGAQYGLTAGVEFRSPVADKILRIYRDVYLPAGRPKIGPEFAQLVVDFFSAPRIKMNIHFLPSAESSDPYYSPEQLRNLRRYVKRAEAYMSAAAIGDFPGTSSFE